MGKEKSPKLKTLPCDGLGTVRVTLNSVAGSVNYRSRSSVQPEKPHVFVCQLSLATFVGDWLVIERTGEGLCDIAIPCRCVEFVEVGTPNEKW